MADKVFSAPLYQELQLSVQFPALFYPTSQMTKRYLYFTDKDLWYQMKLLKLKTFSRVEMLLLTYNIDMSNIQPILTPRFTQAKKKKVVK